MSLLTGGLHHLTIRTTDLARAKRFYVETLGFQAVRERDGSVLLNAHGTLLGVLGAAPETSPDDRFDPLRVGLDHLPLACDNEDSSLRSWLSGSTSTRSVKGVRVWLCLPRTVLFTCIPVYSRALTALSLIPTWPSTSLRYGAG